MNKLILITLIIVTSIFASSCNNNKMPKDLELRKENINQICDQWSSKNAVENRIENLGYVQLSIQLNSTSGCRYQWLVQFISDAGQSGYCAISTDGSSGIVEIVNVTCN